MADPQPTDQGDQSSGDDLISQFAGILSGLATGGSGKSVVPIDESRIAKPIGVPDYTYYKDATGKVQRAPWAGVPVPSNEPGVPFYVQPRYYEGDETDMFVGLSPEAVAVLQSKMVSAGLLTGKYNVGTWTQDSAKAFQQVLGYANQRGVSWQDALDEYEASGQAFAAAHPAKGPVFTARLSNPDDVKEVLRQASYNLLGGKFIDPAQEDAFVGSFNQMELNSQRAAFDAQTGGGGTVVDAPSAATAAETEVKTLDPAGARAKLFDDYGTVFGNLLNKAAPQ